MPPKKINNPVLDTNSKKKYVKKDPLEHVLLRPDMYIGSTKLRDQEEYIAIIENDDYKIIKKNIKTSPGIARIFIEVLSNAIDNAERSKNTKTPCTTIRVNISKKTGETSIWNDGDIIPVEMDEIEKCYNHSLIFGQLLTGSNYDDEEERLTSGRNGLGTKCTNIFSSKFSVKGLDPNNKKILTQTWTENMKTTTGPVIENTKLTKGYTEVQWILDFKQFGVSEYTDDIVNLYIKYVLDSAMLTKINIYLTTDEIQDKKILIKDLAQYAKLYDTPTDECLLIKTSTSEVVVTPASEFEAISFVNGIYTRNGGVHVNNWSEELFRPLVSKFNKKGKPQLTIKDIKQFFRIFVVCNIVNPAFSSQEKTLLESPNVVAEVKTTHVNAIMKWSIVEDIENIIRSKEMGVLKKSQSKKKFVKIEGYDPANEAGGKKALDCGLILCEGLSAKTYAVAGIEKGVYGKSGRNWWGILALRGKCLNVRNSSPAIIAKNNVISDLIQALGLKYDVDYKDDKHFKTLNYGQVMFLTDADVDGLHIESLLMNFFHSLFPTLLERPTPFLISMKTPIVRVFKPRGDLLFYDERKFREYAAQQTTNFKKKYYKGLGTTKPEDVPDTFGLKMIEYVNDADTNTNMNKVFNKKFADNRKEWLAQYNANNSISLDDEGEIVNMNISYFLNNETIKFSRDDCKRSIPNLIDGLKTSQRKVLFALKKKKLKYTGQSLKVAQLGGYVAEHSNYHHGEQNLYETIINMAQEFPGSNNIPLLYRDGMFGTRIAGGKDAASARYIYTKMDALTNLIFREEDDNLLQYIEDDGDSVEPYYYVPILPMLLVNGISCGIGTGWSCNIPAYNPLDIISCIRTWLDNDGEIFIEDPDTNATMTILPELTPWYRGFTGKIEKNDDHKYITYGICEKGPKNTTIITELPINMWTDKFKEICEDHIENKLLKSMKNYSSPKTVNFALTESDDGFNCSIESLKLHSYLYTSNMVLFDAQENIKKYNTVDEIINEFCKVRLELYAKRKKYILNTLKTEMKFLSNKERFIGEVIAKSLNIMNEKEDVILRELEKRKYDKQEKSNSSDEDTTTTNGYDYLLKLQVRTFTKDKIEQLKAEITVIKNKITDIENTTEKKMWLNELKEFEVEYTKWLKTMEAVPATGSTKKSKK
uniref:DNA topoisomerase (ATP-hydrolyzing) n=1 Tax=viral metagenome TaxID=1070528 RepID=A0A6C0CZA3_9ZZZZ